MGQEKQTLTNKKVQNTADPKRKIARKEVSFLLSTLLRFAFCLLSV